MASIKGSGQNAPRDTSIPEARLQQVAAWAFAVEQGRQATVSDSTRLAQLYETAAVLGAAELSYSALKEVIDETGRRAAAGAVLMSAANPFIRPAESSVSVPAIYNNVGGADRNTLQQTLPPDRQQLVGDAPVPEQVGQNAVPASDVTPALSEPLAAPVMPSEAAPVPQVETLPNEVSNFAHNAPTGGIENSGSLTPPLPNTQREGAASLNAAKKKTDPAALKKQLDSKKPLQDSRKAEKAPGAVDKFKQGVQDRKAGKNLKDVYGSTKSGFGALDKAGASAVKGLGSAAGGQAAKGTANAAGKSLVQGSAKAGGSVVPYASLVTAIDAKGALRTAKEAKSAAAEGKFGTAAAKAVVGTWKTTAVTVFRVSKDFYIIGLTWGLSLLVTWLLGTLLLFNKDMSTLDRLLVVALNIALLGILATLLLLFIFGACNSGGGFAVWAASFVSSTANQVNELCKPFSSFQRAKSLF